MIKKMMKIINKEEDYIATDISTKKCCKIIQVESISNDRYVIGYIMYYKTLNSVTCELEYGFTKNKVGKAFIKFCTEVLDIAKHQVLLSYS